VLIIIVTHLPTPRIRISSMNKLSNLTFILGAAASGKSKFAENLCETTGLNKIYVATAQAFDDEMVHKINRHLAQRGDNWTTIEAPLDVAKALDTATSSDVVLLDCATLWLTNVILGDHDLDAQSALLLAALSRCAAPVVVVALSRKFRNAQGRLNQDIAARADTVVAVMAGLPMVLKGAV